jgi:hypothetical protein
MGNFILSPTSGSVCGNTNFTITGDPTVLASVVAVQFGDIGVPQSQWSVVGGVLSGTTPQSGGYQSGPVQVQLIIPKGPINVEPLYQYNIVTLIDGVSPNSGQSGILVTVKGSRFITGGSPVMDVRFGLVQATIFTVVSDTELTVEVPPYESGSEAVDIQVLTCVWSPITPDDTFTYN